MKDIGHLSVTKSSRGFTIVELLIVIVVIGILAAITIVSFNGVTKRATQAQIAADLSNSVTKLKLDMVDLGNSYPLTVASANGGQGLPASSGTTYQYTVDNSVNPPTFCLTATNGSTSYFTTQNGGAPTAGACPGHAVGGPPIITNYMPNPGGEVNTTDWTIPNGSAVSHDTTVFHSGSASIKVTMPANTSGTVGTGYIMGSSAVPSILEPNTTYSFSAWVYIPSTTTVGIESTVQGTGYSQKDNGASASTNTKNTWVLLTNSFTTKASGNINLYYLNNATTTAGQVFYIDDAMLTKGTNVYNYADGSHTAQGWSWTGTANDSSSSGPVL